MLNVRPCPDINQHFSARLAVSKREKYPMEAIFSPGLLGKLQELLLNMKYESLLGKTDVYGRCCCWVNNTQEGNCVTKATVTKVEINAILSFSHFLQFPSTTAMSRFSFHKHLLLLLLSHQLTVIAPFLVSNTTFCLEYILLHTEYFYRL